jgi:hypothetical protein
LHEAERVLAHTPITLFVRCCHRRHSHRTITDNHRLQAAFVADMAAGVAAGTQYTLQMVRDVEASYWSSAAAPAGRRSLLTINTPGTATTLPFYRFASGINAIAPVNGRAVLMGASGANNNPNTPQGANALLSLDSGLSFLKVRRRRAASPQFRGARPSRASSPLPFSATAGPGLVAVPGPPSR